MSKWLAVAGVAVAMLVSSIALAQDEVSEVVVTAERRDDQGVRVVIVKRADHMITTVRVTCDTRDANQRHEELKATLRNMIHAASATKTISLSTGDSVLIKLEENNLDDLMIPDTRPDTNQIQVVVKTEVSKTDTLKSATARIRDFVGSTPKVGRTEIVRTDNYDLTLIGPEQYRDALISSIVADAKHTAELFGPGYGVAVEGLEHPVSWYQKGPLDLALYVPYTLHIAPVH
ncbi:MAG: hypothetical protein HY243_11600 [Proteobacteria bacterium]|nr:hypothetical protein [Pseudomonadota bacterium]